MTASSHEDRQGSFGFFWDSQRRQRKGLILCELTTIVVGMGDALRELDTDQILKDISDRARKHRISMAELCRQAKIAQSTFVRWKNGSMSPTVDCLNLLIRALNQVTASKSA